MHTRMEALSLFEFKEPWEWHCLIVASLSENIAAHIEGLDTEYAFIYGLFHDIGRSTKRGKLEPKSHPVEGYKFLTKRGFAKEAMSCITHTFPRLDDITLVPGMCHPEWTPEKDIKKLKFDEIDSFIIQILDGYQPTIYDSIVLLADLMSSNNKTVRIEERLARVYDRYGNKPNKESVLQAIEERKREVEARTHKKIEEIVGL